MAEGVKNSWGSSNVRSGVWCSNIAYPTRVNLGGKYKEPRCSGVECIILIYPSRQMRRLIQSDIRLRRSMHFHVRLIYTTIIIVHQFPFILCAEYLWQGESKASHALSVFSNVGLAILLWVSGLREEHTLIAGGLLFLAHAAWLTHNQLPSSHYCLPLCYWIDVPLACSRSWYPVQG